MHGPSGLAPQVSRPSHGFPLSHGFWPAGMGMLTQAPVPLHCSVPLHAKASSEHDTPDETGDPATQLPVPLQCSIPLQRLLSGQVTEVDFGDVEPHAPLVQVAALVQAVPATHTMPFVFGERADRRPKSPYRRRCRDMWCPRDRSCRTKRRS